MGKVYCLDRTPWLGPNPVWQSNLILSSSSRFHSSGFCNSDEFCSKSNCVLWEMNLCHFLLFYFFKSVLEFFRLVDECRGIFLFHWYHPIRELLIYIYFYNPLPLQKSHGWARSSCTWAHQMSNDFSKLECIPKHVCTNIFPLFTSLVCWREMQAFFIYT